MRGEEWAQCQSTLAANHRDGSRAQHGHPCAEDPGKGSGFDQEVSCSSEGAGVEPLDPWGETLEARNLIEQMNKEYYFRILQIPQELN